jgi:hypothetical protein
VPGTTRAPLIPGLSAQFASPVDAESITRITVHAAPVFGIPPGATGAPPEGKRWWYVDVTVSAPNKASLVHVWTLADSKNNGWRPKTVYTSYEAAQLSFAILNAGDSVRGYLVFELDNDAAPVQLRIGYSSSSGYEVLMDVQ